MPDRDTEFQSLTEPVRTGEIPWSVPGFHAARTVVRRARSGKLRLPPAVAGLPAEVLEETGTDELALGLWLRREHRADPPEVPAAHHLRFHAIEHFLAQHADLLVEEGLLKPPPDADGDDLSSEASSGLSAEELEPDPLLLDELVARPYDSPLAGDAPPAFDAGEVLKAVARRARLG